MIGQIRRLSMAVPSAWARSWLRNIPAVSILSVLPGSLVTTVKTLSLPCKILLTHKTLTVVNDQHGRPTWTRTLTEFMTHLAENQKEFGYYHLSNAAEDTTWYDFAVEILKDTDVEVQPVDSSKFPAKAKRPFNSTMSLTKAKATGFVIPTWQDALKEFYKQERSSNWLYKEGHSCPFFIG